MGEELPEDVPVLHGQCNEGLAIAQGIPVQYRVLEGG